MHTLLKLLVISAFLFSCKRENVITVTTDDKVEIYLLQSFTTVVDKCQVDSTTAVLENDPLITNEEILSYNKLNYQYKLTSNAVSKIKQRGGRLPFALTVNKKIIFYGYYMPSVMSSTCEHSITMKEISDTKILMSLGYPFDYRENVEDKRNDAYLLNTLRKQGKLK